MSGSRTSVKVRPGTCGSSRAQPRISTNRQGLLIGFEITGSTVNGEPATESLLVNFGDIDPQGSGTARWIMETTLSGEFIAFTADYTHADELGGELTTLIDTNNITTHSLVHDILMDLPGRDAIRDFLAKDDNVVRVYTSDGTDHEVTRIHEGITGVVFTNITRRATEEDLYELKVPRGLEKPFYLSITNRPFGAKTVKSVLRDDGKKIHEANAWISKVRKELRQGFEYDFNLFDADGKGGSYTIRIADEEPRIAVPPTLAIETNRVVVFEGDTVEFEVKAEDPNGDLLSLEARELHANATFILSEKKDSGQFNWQTEPGDYGVYFILFTATDEEEFLAEDEVVIYVARPGEERNQDGIPVTLTGWNEPPLSPRNLMYESSKTNALITWEAPEGQHADVVGYRIRYDSSMVELGIDEVEYLIPDLESGTSVVVRVTAYDNEQPPRESSSVGLTAYTLLDNPTNLHAKGFHEEVDLAWDWNGPTNFLSQFEVYYAETNFIDLLDASLYQSTTNSVLTVSNLVNDTVYHFAVAAANLDTNVDLTANTVFTSTVTDVFPPELEEFRFGDLSIEEGSVLRLPDDLVITARDRAGVKEIELSH